MRIGKNKKLKIFETFLEDNKTSPKNLSSYPEYSLILEDIPQYNCLPEQIIPTVHCIIEGLLHAYLIKQLPLFHIIFNEIKKETEMC